MQQQENHIAQLEQEKQFANDRIAQLEKSLRQRDEEVTQYTQRFVNGEAEVEHLREEMSRLKRDHSHVALTNELAYFRSRLISNKPCKTEWKTSHGPRLKLISS